MEIGTTCPNCQSTGEDTFMDEYTGNYRCGDCGYRGDGSDSSVRTFNRNQKKKDVTDIRVNL